MEEPATRVGRGRKQCWESSQKTGLRALGHCEGLAGGHRQRRRSPGATLRCRACVGSGESRARGVCVARSGEGHGSSRLGCLRTPTPDSQAGTYLMAFFSLRPRPESGVPTVSKELL